ncbi:Two-component sensor histidine kinase, contains HisKA and HATPase domains [Flavobacteriaceae bacterium MAR_2010_188]|nr:Two-component sensor histidine kinase, contains HisKA and HATPase domains [Flavobacteriaceae bacterium MAR_2010_188]
MKISSIFCSVIFTFLPVLQSRSQIVTHNPDTIYHKIFFDTDDFGSNYLDTLSVYYPMLTDQEIRFSMLNDLAYYWHTRNLNTALKYTEEGLRLTNFSKNNIWQGRFQITQGSILLRQEKLDSAYAVLESAKSKVPKEDLPFLNTQLGYVFERKGELDKAADYAMIGLELGKELKDLKAQALAYSDLSNLFWKQSKFTKGLEFGLKSLELFEERGIDDLDYDFTLYVVGNNYLALKDFAKALDYYEKSMLIGERYGFYNNLSDVYISLAELYSDLGEIEQAISAGENGLKYAELLENDFMIMRSWLSLGKVNNQEGNYSRAIEDLNNCIRIATENFGDEYYLSQAYLELATAYSQKGQYKDAFEASQRYDTLKDRIFTSEADQRISRLQTEYDVSIKEETIARQDAQIEKQQLSQIMTVVVVIFLCVFLIVLGIFLKKNNKKNRLLEKQNEEKNYLLKEIHHRVKNNLEIVSGLLALQSAQIEDQNVVNAMQESQNRVHSMSMIHQKLYQGKNLATIEMKDYLMNLGEHILDSFGAENRVDLNYVMDELELDVDTAVPLGLIVNELITNSLKYAFPGEGNGKIQILLNRPDARVLQLEVRDNGVGKNDKEELGTGFGTQLIQLLIQQLNGEMVEKNEGGTAVAFKFNLKKSA